MTVENLAATDERPVSAWSEYDHLTAAAQPDPAGLIAPLRGECPVGRSEQHGGFYVLTSAADVREAARHSELFSSQPDRGPGSGFPHSKGHGMIRYDPPLHRDFRRPLQKRFAAASVRGMGEHFRILVTELIDDFIEAGQADFAAQLSVPLPVAVTCELLDLPWERRHELRDWSQRLVAHGAPDARQNLSDFVADLYDQRVASPGEDIPSEMLRMTIGGQPISREQWIDQVMLLINAGLDTTSNAGAMILHYMATEPGVRRQIEESPENLPAALDEMLRLLSPVPQHSRGVTTDCEIGGHRFKQGDVVLLSWLSADHDPAAFPDPERFKPDRSPNRNYAFGDGRHRCLGSHLARVELTVLLEEVLKRMPDYQVVEGGVTRYPGLNRGMSGLCMTFTPGPRVGAVR